MTTTYSITDLAREFEVTTRTIRHYEDEGLLNPAEGGMMGSQEVLGCPKYSWLMQHQKSFPRPMLAYAAVYENESNTHSGLCTAGIHGFDHGIYRKV